MATSYNRKINLYINGKEVRNDISSIKKEMFKLQSAQNHMTRGSAEYVAQGKKIRYLKGILTKHRQQLDETKKSWFSLSKAADKFNRYFGMISGALASLVGLALGFRKASDEAGKFEERLDNLSALTGLEGKELEWLGKTAKATSIEITKSGIRIKQAASDILDAYTKVGSQRPELLKNKEALHEVAKDAIILSEAAKSELEPAVKGLTTTLNQHNLEATESRRVINAMAAGSKEGAADIPYLTEAMEKSGTTMRLMNVSLEQNIGLIEAIAPNYAQARMAGNSLDKVFLKLKANQIGYVNGVFDVNTALDQLEDKYNNGETAAEIFGVEHAKMGELLVMNRKEFNRYTKAVTGTNVAIEQAIKNTNNSKAALAQARNQMNLTLIAFGDKLNPVLLKSTNLVNYLIKALIKAPKWFKDNQGLLILLAAAVIAYNGALITHIALQAKSMILKGKDLILDKLHVISIYARATATRIMVAVTGQATIAQKRLIIAQRQLNASMMANPLGIVLAGLLALVAAIKLYDRYNAFAVKREKEKKEATELLVKTNETLKSSYTDLQTQIGQLNRLSFNEKKDLQDKIDKTIELAEAELVLQQAKQLEIQESNTQATFWQKTKNLLLSAGNGYLAVANNMKDAVINGYEASQTMQDGIDGLMERIAAFKRQKIDLNEILFAESTADDILGDTISSIEEKLNLYQIALKNVKIGSEDYLRVQKKIIATEDVLDKIRGKATAKLTDEQKKVKDLLSKAENELKNAKIASLEDGIKKERELENQRWKEEEEALKARLITKKDLSADEIALNETLNQTLEEKKQQHLDRLNDLDKADAERKKLEALEIDLLLAETDNDRWLAKMALLKEQFDKEFDQAEGNRKKELEAEKKFTDAVKDLDKEKVNARLEEFVAKKEIQIASLQVAKDGLATLSQLVGEETAMGKAFFLLSQAAAVGQIIFNTAIANAKAVAASPLTFGQPWVAVNSISAGVSIAAILAQSIGKLTGYESGGFTQGEGIYVAGEKGMKEWISPNWMVNDPNTGPVIASLEAYRKNRVVVNPDIFDNAPKLFHGGYSEPSSTNQTNTENQNPTQPYTATPDFDKFDKAVERLEKLEWILSVEEFERKRDSYKKQTTNTGL